MITVITHNYPPVKCKKMWNNPEGWIIFRENPGFSRSVWEQFSRWTPKLSSLGSWGTSASQTRVLHSEASEFFLIHDRGGTAPPGYVFSSPISVSIPFCLYPSWCQTWCSQSMPQFFSKVLGWMGRPCYARNVAVIFHSWLMVIWGFHFNIFGGFP